MRRIVIAAIAATLAACIPPAKKQTAIVDADASMVAACTYVGDVDGMSGFGGPLGGDYGISKARNLARNEAVKLGATHLVWMNAASPWISTASGKAYRCDD